MFAGIVEVVGTVRRGLAGGAGGHSLELPAGLLQRLRVGDSLAVNGCCLTVVELDATGVVADVMPETARRTTLAALAAGAAVNCETALAFGAPVGGHLLTGHIDAVGRVAGRRPEGNAVRVTIAVPPPVHRYCVAQGSLAVDGCSLTLAAVEPKTVTVALIPHTLAVTVAGAYTVGTAVNLEADLVAKYVDRLLEPHRAGAGRTGS